MSTRKRKWISCFFGIFCYFAMNSVAATVRNAEECPQEILLSYYPGVFVQDVLRRFDVSQEKWDTISKELAVRDKEILKIVEAKATKMDPNPLKDPQQRQAAGKLIRDTVNENFGEVMRMNGITDDKKIQAMLDDIKQQKAQRFARCLEQLRAPSSPAEKDSEPTHQED